MSILPVKQDSKRIEPSSELLKFAIDRSMDAIFFMDPDARFVYANRAACRNLRYSMDELFSMTLHDIDTNLSPEECHRHWINLKERGSVLFQAHYQRKSGTQMAVEVLSNYIQFKGQEYNCSFVRNIAGRKRIENAIRLGRKELERTLDAISDWVCLIDLHSKILRTNRQAEQISGLSLRSIIGQTCCKIMHGNEITIPECPLPIMINTGKRESIEFQLPDGRWTMITVDPVRNERGHITGAVHSVRDITDRKTNEHKQKKRLGDLNTAIQKRKSLSGILPVCSGCKKIRDDQGLWNPIELYIGSRSEAEFNHSICPDCAKILYPYLDFYDEYGLLINQR